MSEAKTSGVSESQDERESQGPSGGRGEAQPRCPHLREEGEEEDSGCECSVEELERMDSWTKTLVAIKESLLNLYFNTKVFLLCAGVNRI